MRLKKLSCADFRNFSQLEFCPCDKMNVICGENGEGKTNLIEAVWMFTGAKSFRHSRDSEMKKFGCERAMLNAEFESDGAVCEARIDIDEKRTAQLNGNKLKSPSELSEVFRAVVFSPGELALITEGPAVRRRFIDTAVGQLYPRYAEILKSYSRALVQRNSVIREYKYDPTLSVILDSFEQELVRAGGKIIDYRKRYIEILKETVPEIYSGLSAKKESFDIAYRCSGNKDELEKLLYGARKSDAETGVTSVGPHRDDAEFSISGVSARSFGSQGQKRSAALSLKLSQAEIIKKVTGEYPVCLLDDVMSELDKQRQEYVLNHIKGMQSVLSCCDLTNAQGLEAGRLFIMKKGVISG